MWWRAAEQANNWTLSLDFSFKLFANLKKKQQYVKKSVLHWQVQTKSPR